MENSKLNILNDDISSEAQIPKSNKKLHTALLRTPFKKIALSLSGGGFRAAAYSLGTMSYLHQLKYPTAQENDRRVLDNVEFVASASGGTFPGMLYTMHVCQGQPFEVTYKKLIEFLDGQILLDNVLERINNSSEWKDEKSKNLINAFASIYDEKLFEGNTFGVYSPTPYTQRKIEVCFNTTEFYRGISFRFQATNFSKPLGKVGNKFVYFNTENPVALETMKKIKLGDIMAASSCFPGGFEPMMFPTDFTYSKNGKKELDETALKASLIVKDYNNKDRPESDKMNIGLMDGGINDNQGLYSTLLADRRRRNKPDNGFNLIFISDVASYFMDAYKQPEESIEGSFRKQNLLQFLQKPVKTLLPVKYSRLAAWWSWITLLIIFMMTVIYFVSENSSVKTLVFFFGVMCLPVTVILFLMRICVLNKPLQKFLPAILGFNKGNLSKVLKENIQGLENFTDESIDRLATFIGKTNLGKLEHMVLTRLNSMLSLVMDINLKQTRRLIFDTFYGEFYGNDIWQDRRVFNVIYELSSKNEHNRKSVLNEKFFKEYGFGQLETENDWANKAIKELTDGCDELLVIAEKARIMGTTLWTDQKDMHEKRIQNVVATGQFTTCAKLLEYCLVIERLLDMQEKFPDLKKRIVLNDDEKEIFTAIKEQVKEDWISFKSNPYFLYELSSNQN